jgi:hypothetical protein
MLAADFALALSPTEFAVECGLTPDPWQAEALESPSRKLLFNCSRQSGKSTIAACTALHEAIYSAPALCLLVSPSQRQSVELFRKVDELFQALPQRPERLLTSGLRMEFLNGSRIIALPGSEATIRGYSGAALCIVDEASRVPDELAAAVRPMLATTNGRLIALSTPYGRRGWFHESWVNGTGWKKVRVTAEDCPRISAEFLADELKELGEWQYRQEYCCEFVDTEEQLFSSAIINAALSDEVRPLWI